MEEEERPLPPHAAVLALDTGFRMDEDEDGLIVEIPSGYLQPRPNSSSFDLPISPVWARYLANALVEAADEAEGCTPAAEVMRALKKENDRLRTELEPLRNSHRDLLRGYSEFARRIRDLTRRDPRLPEQAETEDGSAVVHLVPGGIKVKNAGEEVHMMVPSAEYPLFDLTREQAHYLAHSLLRAVGEEAGEPPRAS